MDIFHPRAPDGDSQPRPGKLQPASAVPLDQLRLSDDVWPRINDYLGNDYLGKHIAMLTGSYKGAQASARPVRLEFSTYREGDRTDEDFARSQKYAIDEIRASVARCETHYKVQLAIVLNGFINVDAAITALNAVQSKIHSLEIVGCEGLPSINTLSKFENLHTLSLRLDFSGYREGDPTAEEYAREKIRAIMAGFTTMARYKVQLAIVLTDFIEVDAAITALNAVQSKIHSLKMVRCDGLTSINALSQFENMHTLSLEEHAFFSQNCTSLEALVHDCTSLKTLTLDWCNLEDTRLDNVVHNCTSLKELTLNRCQLTDVEIVPCSNIKILKIIECCQLLTLNIPGLKHLETLAITKCRDLRTVQGLSENHVIKALVLCQCDSLVKVNIADCTKLTKLNLAHCRKLVEVNIAGCTKLAELNLANCSQLGGGDLGGGEEVV